MSIVTYVVSPNIKLEGMRASVTHLNRSGQGERAGLRVVSPGLESMSAGTRGVASGEYPRVYAHHARRAMKSAYATVHACACPLNGSDASMIAGYATRPRRL